MHRTACPRRSGAHSVCYIPAPPLTSQSCEEAAADSCQAATIVTTEMATGQTVNKQQKCCDSKAYGQDRWLFKRCPHQRGKVCFAFNYELTIAAPGDSYCCEMSRYLQCMRNKMKSCPAVDVAAIEAAINIGEDFPNCTEFSSLAGTCDAAKNVSRTASPQITLTGTALYAIAAVAVVGSIALVVAMIACMLKRSRNNDGQENIKMRRLSNLQFLKQGYFSKVYRAQLTIRNSSREVAVKMLKERELRNFITHSNYLSSMQS